MSMASVGSYLTALDTFILYTFFLCSWHLDSPSSCVCSRARTCVCDGRGGVERGREREMCVLRASRSNAQQRRRRLIAAFSPPDETRTQIVELTFMSQFRGRVRSRSLVKCVRERSGALLSALCAPPSVWVF